MSTTETRAVPAGTWALGPVHSTIGFADGYVAGTFTGGFSQFDAVVTDGVLRSIDGLPIPSEIAAMSDARRSRNLRKVNP